MTIQRGDQVEATTASGRSVQMRALGSPQQGRDFPVLWVCTESEWARAGAEADAPDGLPWPLDSIQEMVQA